MWDNFLITLSIMGKGMVGIFTVIIIISLVVALMCRLGSGKKTDEKKSGKEQPSRRAGTIACYRPGSFSVLLLLCGGRNLFSVGFQPAVFHINEDSIPFSYRILKNQFSGKRLHMLLDISL